MQSRNSIPYRTILFAFALLTTTQLLCAADEGLKLDGKSPVYAAASKKAINLTTDVSLEAWIKADKMSNAGGRILDKSEPGTQIGYMLDTHPGNSLRFLNATGMCRYDAQLPADKWTHVVGVFSVSKKIMKLYVNGREVAKVDGPFVPMTRSRVPLCVGSDPKGENRFHGRIKRAAIYSRVLSAEEIQQRSESAQPQPLADVVSEWQFPKSRVKKSSRSPAN